MFCVVCGGAAACRVPTMVVANNATVHLMVLQRISSIYTSEANCETHWDAALQSCYLGPEWLSMTVAGAQAVQDFNNRNGTYVPQFAELAGCDKVLVPAFYDSATSGSASSAVLIDALNGVGGTVQPDYIVGPAASSATIPVATISGVSNPKVVEISYAATSTQLDDVNNFPTFMRTIPTDDAVAFSVCTFWSVDMGCACPPDSTPLPHHHPAPPHPTPAHRRPRRHTADAPPMYAPVRR